MPAPTAAPPAVVLDDVTYGYVPWSTSSKAPWAPSSSTDSPRSSASHTTRPASTASGSSRGASRSSRLTWSPGSARSFEPSSPRNSLAAWTRPHTSSFARPRFRRSPTRTPRRPYLSSYVGPMPRPVVPICSRASGPVEELVERERQVRAIRDVELVLGSDAPLAEGVELGKERLRIEHDAVADQAYRTLNDPRGNLVQHELPGAGVDRVACVRPALIAHDEIGALGEHVDALPFALVAPLGADNHDAVGLRSEHRPSPPSKNAPESGRWSILRRKLDLRERAGNCLRNRSHTLQCQALGRVTQRMDDPCRPPIASHDGHALARRATQHEAVYQHRQPARPPRTEGGGYPLDGGPGAMDEGDRAAAIVDTIEVDDTRVAEQVGPLPPERPGAEEAVFLGIGQQHAHSRVRRQGVERGEDGYHPCRVVDRARRMIGHTVGRKQQDARHAGGADEHVGHTRVQRTEQRAHRQGEELEPPEDRQRGGHEAGGHREGLAFRVVVGDEPHRDASPGADRDHVDAF